ncbi:hypothetical protein F8388_018823 [Cannabis sativa]|uniref:Uncharacterized protein n=1 Tax=Cannabis sativa TaxID=3483 RepID=A0A7J6F6U1_CANSA|nr:hypothetical protein F8388_018823 [Cannabis sativa]KAF4403562.1 hypothetical protein G4B88_002415 [Cannabis sativa]
MAEDEAPSPSPSFLEVKCNSSGKTRRFALGTEAGFAVSVINRKLGMGMEVGLPLALYIEATREGHEPITFGPNSTLVNFGDSWILHTVTDLDSSGIGHVENVVRSERSPVSKVRDRSRLVKVTNTKPAISLLYLGKIVFAFTLLFLIGAMFTLALEYLPVFISFVNSSV